MAVAQQEKKHEWLTSAEAAKLIGIEDVTLRNWRSAKKPNSPPYYKPGGTIRYDRTELQEWIEAQRVDPDNLGD